MSDISTYDDRIGVVRRELERRFNHWPPQGFGAIVHDEVRTVLLEAAADLVRLVPPGRQQSLMLTALEEAMHWANAGISYQRAVDAQVEAHVNQNSTAF